MNDLFQRDGLTRARPTSYHPGFIPGPFASDAFETAGFLIEFHRERKKTGNSTICLTPSRSEAAEKLVTYLKSHPGYHIVQHGFHHFRL